MIAIVDYGLGNIHAFINIYKKLGIPAIVAKNEEDIKGADKIILPGVGAFDWAMTKLNASGLRNSLDNAVLREKKPILGVCVGMQMMTNRSEEGNEPGMGWVEGEVVKFSFKTQEIVKPLPHMGWNDIVPVGNAEIFRSIADPKYYFLHSFHVQPRNSSVILAESEYGEKFTSAFKAENIYGMQFHPEKSHHWGVSLLKNFAELS